MRRGTLILALFILVAAGVVGVSLFLRNQPPLIITVAVDSLALDWVREAVGRFNASQPLVNGTRRVQVEITVANEMDVWRGESQWTAQSHPDAWIPTSSVSVEYARNANVPVEIVTESLARTPLVWGGYASRVDVLTANGAQPLDWEAVARAAELESWAALGGQASWQFFKLGFALPDRTMTGLGVLFSGAAAFSDSVNLAGGGVRSTGFYTWMLPIVASVPNFQTLGGDPAKAMTRGPSTVEVALLPEAQWLANLNGMVSNEPVIFSYPAYQFLFDFPLAGWDDVQTTDDQRAAVGALGEWLASAEEQGRLARFGLRPVSSEPDETDAAFANAAAYGIQLAPDYGQAIQAPSRTDAQGLIQWFISNQRR